MLDARPKYSKRVINENYEHTLGKRKQQPRDFGATFMCCPELSRAIKRAVKRQKNCSNPKKVDMYTSQIEAYQSRLNYYFK